jgi:hypothetical protein
MKNEFDPDKEMEVIDEQVGQWLDAFMEKSQYRRLTKDQKENASCIVRLFAECSFMHLGATPEQWDRRVLTEACLEVLPRKMTADLPFFEAVAPVLSAFFDFLADHDLQGKARELSAAVVKLQDDIVAAAQDESSWGPAKSLVMGAQREGVDLTDDKAMQRFIMKYNERMAGKMEAADPRPDFRTSTPGGPAMPVRHSEPKTRRNDPCPCGSGKKFKKCCGA